MLTVRSTINFASQTVPPIIPVVQGDPGRAILFTLADFTIPAGATATYYVQKPSGEAVYNNATIDGNNVLVNLTAQSIIEKGDNYGQVRIAVGEDVVTSFDFILLVKEFRGIDAVQSLTEMNIFDKAVEQAADAIDEVKTDALEAIDDAKDEAIEEVTSNFDLKLDTSSTKGVQNQVITQAINTVNNAIGDLSGETVTPTATNNYGVGGNVGQAIETWATTEYWHGIYAVTAGNRYAIQTVSDYPQQIVVWFTNSSNVILEIHKAFATDHVEMVCTAPTGATKLFVMSYGYDAYHGTVQKVEPLSETVSNLKEDISDIETALETKAEIDGYYEDMTVGNAKQLVSTVTNADDTPYNFRTTAGSADVGDRAYVDAIVGGTVALNQLVDSASIPATKTESGVTFTNNGDGTITVNGTATADIVYAVNPQKTWSDHKYMISGCPKGGSTSTYNLAMRGMGADLFDTGNGNLWNATGNAWKGAVIYIKSGATVTNLVFKPNIFDLTQIFGTTIADYVYGLETATAGAGVAWLKANAPKIFDGGYIPFNAGTLQSVVGLSEKRNTGLNQFDKAMMVNGCFIDDNTGEAKPRSSSKATGYIPVLPGVAYYIKSDQSSGAWGAWYDAEKNYISAITTYYADATEQAKVKTAPDNAHYMRLTCVYNNSGDPDTFCINLHWDGEKDGIYEPYTVHTYAFDPTVELRGVPKLKDGKMYFDGDRYLPDGTVQHRFNEVVLDGSENWAADSDRTGVNSGTVYHRFYLTKNDMYKPSGAGGYRGYILSTIPTTLDGYANDDPYTIPMSITGYTGPSGNYLYIIVNSTLSSIADVAQLKAWLASNHLPVVYELATPTTETATPYNPVEIVDDFGTEEFITTNLVPVGNETRYAPNLRAKLEMSPDSPDGDGLYIVQQSSGENTYIPLASSSTIQNILERLTALEGNTNEG